MNRFLQSPVAVVLIGGALFFITLLATLHATHFGAVEPGAKKFLMATDDPSWKFRNPEIDQWVAQLKEERDALAVREQQLKEWEARLVSENREISSVTQAVSQAQAEFDKRVLLFKDQEKDNAKKQVKVISDMTPEGASAMLGQMSDDEATQLLFVMKPDVSGAILDSMSKLSPMQARRAAALSARLKDVLPVAGTNNLTANASR